MKVVVFLVLLIMSFFVIIDLFSTCLVMAFTIALSALWLMRNTIKKEPIGVFKKVLHSDKTLIEKIYDIFPVASLVICLLVFLVLIFYIINDLSPQAFSSVYSVFLATGAFSSVFELILKDEKMLVWQLISMVLLGLLSVLKDLGMDGESKRIIFWVLAIYIVFLVVSVIVRIKNSKGKKVKKYNKKLYKDLFYRTTNCEADHMSKLELIKHLEKYFSAFTRNYNKKRNIKKIEFGTPYGINRDYWYNRIAKRIKVIFIICGAIICLNAIFLSQWWMLFSLVYFVILYILICAIKIEDGDYLKRILIRLYYDEWGCFLIGNKVEFVGNVQTIGQGNKYKFVHAILNLAAFYRVISFDDRINGNHRMKIVIDNLCDLTKTQKQEGEQNWIEILPLIMASLFEYNNTGMISGNVKKLIYEYKFSDNEKRDMQYFLQGLWATVTGRMPTSNDGLFIRNFSDLLMKE